MAQMTKSPTSLFATSSGLRDELFWDQLKCFFQNVLYTYEFIFKWLGNHSLYSTNGKDLYKEDFEVFKIKYSNLIEYLKGNHKIILLSALYDMVPLNKAQRYKKYFLSYIGLRTPKNIDIEKSQVIKKKNDIIKELSSKYNLTYIDINDLLLKSKYVHKDHVHYQKRANDYIVKQIIERINLK